MARTGAENRLQEAESEVKSMEQMMYTADDVAAMLQVSKSKAYQVIAGLNKELKDLGKLTIRGKINKRYFEKKLEV